MTSKSNTAPLAAIAQSNDDLRRLRYEEVLRDYGPALVRVARSYARNNSERDDLSQDIAIAIWGALPRFRGEASLRTFCFRIAHNCAISQLRKRRIITPEREVTDTTPSAEKLLEAQSEHQRLQLAIRELPIGQRQVLTLNLEGLSYAQVAEVLGISEKNVSVRLSRARQALRKKLEGER